MKEAFLVQKYGFCGPLFQQYEEGSRVVKKLKRLAMECIVCDIKLWTWTAIPLSKNVNSDDNVLATGEARDDSSLDVVCKSRGVTADDCSTSEDDAPPTVLCAAALQAMLTGDMGLGRTLNLKLNYLV